MKRRICAALLAVSACALSFAGCTIPDSKPTNNYYITESQTVSYDKYTNPSSSQTETDNTTTSENKGSSSKFSSNASSSHSPSGSTSSRDASSHRPTSSHYTSSTLGTSSTSRLPEPTETLFYHKVDNSLPRTYLDSYVQRHTADKVVTYKKLGAENLNLCYFYPSNYNKNSKCPVFMVIHGGGWAGRAILPGQTEWSGDWLGYLARYYADKGFLSVVTTYGLLKKSGQDNERQLVDLYVDCQDAMNYVADHAKEYGADLTNVTLLGESAGGHLAGAMATNSFYPNRLPIRTAILVNPITYLDDKWGAGTPTTSTRPLLAGLTKAQINNKLSPLYNITNKTPNVLLLHGDSDTVVSPDHSIQFNDAMNEMGNRSELHLIQGVNHAFLLFEYKKKPYETNAGVKIIDEYFKKYNIMP